MKNLSESTNPIYDLNQLEVLSRELFVNQNELKYLKDLAENMEKISINKVELQWVQVLSEGWAFPLTGFMNENEYLQTLHFNSIKKNGNNFLIITLFVYCWQPEVAVNYCCLFFCLFIICSLLKIIICS